MKVLNTTALLPQNIHLRDLLLPVRLLLVSDPVCITL